MSNSMFVEKEIELKASKAEVWDLLTNPEETKQYMFGSSVISDWKVGSSIFWKGQMEDGTEIIFVKGAITEIEVGERVSFTMFDPNAGMKDIPENYVVLNYELSTSNGGTKLSLRQGDFQGTENAEKRFEESKAGWDMVLPLMKKQIEG